MVERSDLATATLTSAVPRIRTADRLLLSKRVDASLATDLKMITLTRPLAHPIYITLQDGRKGVVHMAKNHKMVKLTSSQSGAVPKVIKSTVVPTVHSKAATATRPRPKPATTTAISKLTTSSAIAKVPAIVSKVAPSARNTTKVAPSTAAAATPKVSNSVTVPKTAKSVPKSTTSPKVSSSSSSSSKQFKMAAPKKVTSKKRRSTTTMTTTTMTEILKRKLPIEYMKIPDEKIRRVCLHPNAIHFFNNPQQTTNLRIRKQHNTEATTTTTSDDELRSPTTTTETTIIYRHLYRSHSSASGKMNHGGRGGGDPLLSAATPTHHDDVINRLMGTSSTVNHDDVIMPPSASTSFDSDSTTLFEPTTELPELEISKLLEEPNDSMEHYHFDPYVAPPDYSSFPAANALSFEEYHHPHSQAIQLSPYEAYSDHYPYDFSMYSRPPSSEVYSPTYTSPSPHYHPHTPQATMQPAFSDGYAAAYHDEVQPPAGHDVRVSPHHYQASPVAAPRFIVSHQQQDTQQQQQMLDYMRSTSSSVGGNRYTNSAADIHLPLGEPLEQHVVSSKKVGKHRTSDVDDSGISSPGSCMSAANSEQIHEDYINSPHYPAMVQQQPPYSPSDSAASGFKPYSLTNLDEYTANVEEEPKYTDLDGVKNLEEAVAMIGIGVHDSMDGGAESNASSIDTVVEVIKPKMYTMEKYVYKKRNNNSRKASKSNGKTMHLWEFIREKLFDARYCPTMIKWENRREGVFRFVQSDKIAAMWGRHKNNEKMTYEKLSRAMRYYYSRQILERVDGKRLVYKFGKHSSGWRLEEVCGQNYHDQTYQHSSPSTPLMIDMSGHQHSPPSTSAVDRSKWIAVNNNAGSSSCQSPASLPGANVLLAAN